MEINDDHVEFDALVASYLPAALALGQTRAEVEEAVALATRFRGRCPSCCNSLAKADAGTIARREGALPVFERQCVLSHLVGLQVCPFWRELEIPLEVQARAVALLEEVLA